jgi:hypothetical protein
MANPAVLAQLQQLVGQLNAFQQTVGNLQASNNTFTTRIATLEAENTTLTTANTTLTAQVQNLPGGAAAGGAAGGGAGAAPLVVFAATPVMVNHQDLINYSTKVGTTIYNEGCKKLTTEFDMKSSGTVVYTTELQDKCVKMGWHMGTQQIINFTNATGSTINIVHQYGYGASQCGPLNNALNPTLGLKTSFIALISRYIPLHTIGANHFYKGGNQKRVPF